MKDSKNIYITTTLPYVNSNPHIGFALEIVQADSLARYFRARGKDVFFNTGTDEHGQKIAEAAKKAGKDTQEYVDFYANEFKKLKELLNLSPDNFIRTTDKRHAKAAQELWLRAAKKGDIYKKKYKGLYCVGCEAFLKDSDLKDGKCPNHPNRDLEELEEENYFFALSKYKDELKKYLEKPNSALPEYRRKEALNILDALEDISISRSKDRLTWGVPVPGDDSQVMYVWFDALSNYISTLGFPDDNETFDKFWNGAYTIQLAGKDQVKFQSIIWQAMLLSADIKNTDTVFYHGFITSGGQKMSKSLGNVISPAELVQKYGIDGTRYILLRHVHPTEDSDITWEKMDEWYTANLVNGLGNLVARITKMSESYLEGEKIELKQTSLDELEEFIYNFEFQAAMDYLWDKVAKMDQKITETEPFKLIKTNPDEAKQIVRSLMQDLYNLAILLHPFMPESTEIIMKAVQENKKPDNLFKRLS